MRNSISLAFIAIFAMTFSLTAQNRNDSGRIGRRTQVEEMDRKKQSGKHGQTAGSERRAENKSGSLV
jgi:hypothetical protein